MSEASERVGMVVGGNKVGRRSLFHIRRQETASVGRRLYKP